LNPGTEVNQDIPGKLEIPANNISVPLIWTQNVADFDNDLKQGTVHYPGTPLPGQIGTAYISGHSSGYIWDHSPYKQVFAILGQVKDGTSFTITVTQKDGKVVKYHYVVERRGEYAANDQAQFISTADSVVALSTCWPVGTTDHRLVLFAKLTQTEKS
jgi:LPXTG-site transpeptidase (sortase) family protein